MTDLRTRATSTDPWDDGTTTASDELAAQRGLFAGPVREVPDELYTEVHAGQVVRHRREVWVGPCSHASTNTYFGRFPASWWWRWTSVRTVTVRGHVEGSGRLLLRASDADGDARTVAAADTVSGEIALSARLDRFADGGGLWLEILTDDAALTLRDVRWTVDTAGPQRAVEVVICTHNRVDDCLTTLRSLGDEQDALDVLTRVTVVDQGTDTLEARDDFADVEKHLQGRFRYLRQHNLGGAGGFTRGLLEAVRSDENGENGGAGTDVIFMDDDVRLEPEVVVRLAAFARCTHQPTIVGAQMLNLLHPTRVRAGAEHTDLVNLAPGLPVGGGAGAESDVTAWLDDEDDNTDVQRKNLQDRRVEAGYNGWWTCLIPVEVTRVMGFPLPMFFQWDDVEYGTRAWSRGVPVVTLPGAALWHADFGWKDYDDWARYFDVRNSLIVAAMHTHFPVRHIAAELGDRLSQALLGMNYGLAATLNAGIEAFLAGPPELDDGGTSAVARMRELRSHHPETVLRGSDEIPLGAGAVGVLPSGPEPKFPRVVKARRLVAHARGRLKFHDGHVRAGDARWYHTSRFAQVVVTDSGQAGVRLRRHDPERLRAVGRDSARMLWRFYREGADAMEQWRAATPTLTSAENWHRLFDQPHRDGPAGPPRKTS